MYTITSAGRKREQNPRRASLIRIIIRDIPTRTVHYSSARPCNNNILLTRAARPTRIFPADFDRTKTFWAGKRTKKIKKYHSISRPNGDILHTCHHCCCSSYVVCSRENSNEIAETKNAPSRSVAPRLTPTRVISDMTPGSNDFERFIG